ncbi:MAG: uroporphyrinogen-III synthase [Nitrososphaerota archaeon]|jgi:uroporphyrinogen-III synthase|uniref:uroporphyrinogen-III synthase n=1 Tax=Candidatus Bathycorpusculum sp. TaxID=2994959 RepID=UPI00282263F5|nr:uroporphyrinogen-III synthase [Candidatus Termiticorpusculum sp.]MCL2257030.1 uroporphyrinogen-III synthase [Candidatus Termiticorpusculum sp.]MCL2292845.1 uroporphyrinogen-III synthase [Candidatus Termiticorpusculum sp.]MDR0460378.1 uroporphyrinogen-III synthase [Nitrososphaerota archaeon]
MVQTAPTLKGKTVALTRPTGQAEEAGKLIKEKNGVPYYIPAIEIRSLSNSEPVKQFITELQTGKVDYVILMSTNGVKHLFEVAQSINQVGALQGGLVKTSVIGVGPRTAQELEAYGVRVDLIPEKYSSEGLLEILAAKEVAGKVIRIPRTTSAAPILKNQLVAMGANVQEVHVYESGLPIDENLKNKFYEDLTNGHIDAVLFGSGLSAKNIFKMLTEKTSMEHLQRLLAEKVTIVAIGPTTAQALKELNIKVDVIPKDYLFEEALSALSEYWAKL